MENLKYVFKSLFSNKTIVEGRHKPWYFAIIFFILGVFLTWIPVMYAGYTAYNSSFFTGTASQEADRGLNYMLNQPYFQEGVKVVTDSDDSTKLELEFDIQQYSRSGSTWNDEYDGTVSAGEEPLAELQFTDSNDAFSHVNVPATNMRHTYYFDAVAVDTSDSIAQSSSTSATDGAENVSKRSVVLEIYFLPDVYVTKNDKTMSDYFSNFISGVILGVNSTGEATKYSHSYIIFTPDSVSIAVAPLVGSKGGAFTHAQSGYVNDGLKYLNAKADTTLYSYFVNVEGKDTFKAFADFFHNTAQQSNITSVWINIGILSGVVVGLELLSALVIFFLHRRKTSAYKDVNFWTALKEAMTIGFTPCILGMALGFMSFTYNITLVVSGILLRTVWINNKISPISTDGKDNKPLYQARS